MKNVKRTLMLLAIAAVAFSGASSQAAFINGQNWADSVVSYTSQIQNYGGTLMDSTTEFWVLGQSDVDLNGNMYAWDTGEPDYVAGWRSVAANQEIIVGFNTALEDIAGDDLVIRLYGGPNAQASVSVSEDNSSWTSIGTITGESGQIPGTPGYLYDAAFDFSGLFSGDAYYVKVHRDVAGPQTGMFFDSFASVPEPATMLILGLGAAFVRRRK
ncbi:hypothetical protein L21SP3_01668 [Sedimentisphaera cyanobacteriorum]|uniref:Ice-binding protein C-terminal domain-containing protein n=1 Tax=Sedimentisphaera cyanobacteriorum TaxID=1940790 RepID=A0A1Q2HQW2_9BACT|nr:PEP-CTERM sorting domain-containing protein [Sedimentisphaera cyanobacteriorum]AQQ09849.1 hypothetical protein L21SP3_01668 [Sedimentisphaera cyanobacteriorum]